MQYVKYKGKEEKEYSISGWLWLVQKDHVKG